MITLKLKISECENRDFILKKQQDYSYAFRKLYKNYNKVEDKKFINYLRNEYNLLVFDVTSSLKIDIKTKINQQKTWKKQTEQKIKILKIEYEELLGKKQIKNVIRKKFNLNKKISYLEKSIDKDIVFGGKKLLSEITKENDKTKRQELKQEWNKKRLLPISMIGSLHDMNGNRYFNFNFLDKEITYKPNKNNHIKINYKCDKNYQQKLLQLQEMKNLLPISVKLSTEYIYITYNEEILNGYGLDVKNLKSELTKIQDKETRKSIYRKYFIQQENKKLQNKIKNRYLGIDLNPNNIGCSIIDNINNEVKIIKIWNYNLSNLTKKLGLDSKNSKQIKQNNKRKFEIGKIYKQIFEIAKHYKVGYFVYEDLNFNFLSSNTNFKEFNRKTKNIWNREFQTNLIKKHCNELGIIRIEVSPIYSSFIGNIINNKYPDSIASAIEIERRGFNKYKKGNGLYPKLTNTIFDTTSKLLKSRDVQKLKDCNSWKQLYKLFRDTKVKYRRTLNNLKFDVFSMNTIKSLVKTYCFN